MRLQRCNWSGSQTAAFHMPHNELKMQTSIVFVPAKVARTSAHGFVGRQQGFHLMVSFNLIRDQITGSFGPQKSLEPTFPGYSRWVAHSDRLRHRIQRYSGTFFLIQLWFEKAKDNGGQGQIEILYQNWFHNLPMQTDVFCGNVPYYGVLNDAWFLTIYIYIYIHWSLLQSHPFWMFLSSARCTSFLLRFKWSPCPSEIQARTSGVELVGDGGHLFERLLALNSRHFAWSANVGSSFVFTHSRIDWALTFFVEVIMTCDVRVVARFPACEAERATVWD